MISSTIPTASGREARRVLLRLLRPQRTRVLIASIALILGTGSQLVCTRIIGMIIDAVANSDGAHRINILGAWTAAAVVAAAILVYVGRLVMAAAVERAMHTLRRDSFDATLHLPLSTVEYVGVSEPLGRMTNDVAGVYDGLQDSFPTIVVGGLTVVLACIALVITSPLIALGATAGFIVVYVALRQYFKRSTTAYQDEREASSGIVREMHEIAEGARTLRTFNRQGYSMQRIRAAGESEWNAAWPPARARCVLYSGVSIARIVSLSCVLVVGMIAYANGWASIGAVSAASLYISQLYLPLGDLLDNLDSLQQATAAGSRLTGLTLMQREDNVELDEPTEGSVALRNVTFSYDVHRDVVNGVNLNIQPGEKIAVVGASGAGKSTIAKLIAGIHHPQHGTIEIGGQPASSEVPASAHRTVAMVTQESHVFSGSLASNLRLANGEADDIALLSVLDTVGATSWVKHLPEGIETFVGIDGHPLTLLQAQQVALARILLADPLVVILDEATASFDSDSVRGVENSFAAVFQGRTVITIAHRLDVASTADRVVVVDAGTLTAGTHDSLLSDHRGYATMWSHWTKRGTL